MPELGADLFGDMTDEEAEAEINRVLAARPEMFERIDGPDGIRWRLGNNSRDDAPFSHAELQAPF